jgi:hypothetical protein
MTDFYGPELAAPVLPLVRGSTDRAAVRRLQEWLVLRGYSAVRDLRHAPGIDGDYGEGTAAGVAAFAKANGLQPVVDDWFWHRLIAPMVTASTFRPKSKDLGQAIVQVAECHLMQGAREARQLVGDQLQGADNSGPWVRAYIGQAVPPAPWCQGAANRWRDRAAATLGVALKVPTRLDGIDCLWVPSVVEEHRRLNLLVSGRQLGSSVRPGCLFFVPGTVNGGWSHIHVGVVAQVRGATVETIEGNTDQKAGSPNGWLVCRRERPIAGLDFGLLE